jgi:hypothetical protein
MKASVAGLTTIPLFDIIGSQNWSCTATWKKCVRGKVLFMIWIYVRMLMTIVLLNSYTVSLYINRVNTWCAFYWLLNEAIMLF